jgi:hypothetical protein
MEGYQSLGMAWANILDGGLAEYVRRIWITEPQVASDTTFKAHIFSRNGAGRQRVGRNLWEGIAAGLSSI